MAQVGSGILLGCCVYSGSVNVRLRFEFLSVNIIFFFKIYF